MKKVSKICIIWLLWIALFPSLVKANDRDKLLKAHIDKTVKVLNQRLKHNQQLLLVKKNTDLDVIIDRYYVQVAKNTDKYLPINSYLNDATKKQLNKILGKLRTLDFGYGNAYMYVLITSGPPLVNAQENLLKSKEKHKKASEEYLKKIQAAIAEQIKEESEKFANSVFFNSDLGKSSNNGLLLNLYIQKVVYHERGQKSFHKYHHAYNVVGAQGKVSQIIKKQLRDIVVGTELRQMIKSSNSGSNLRYYASKLTTSLKRNHIVRCATYAIAEKFFAEFGYKVPNVDYSNIQSFESFFVSGSHTTTSLLSYSKRDALVAERIYWKFRQFTTLFGARDKRFVSGFRFIQNPRFQWSKILSLDEKTPINPEKIFTAEELTFIKKQVNKTARQKSGTTLREVFPILYMINNQMWVITDRDSQTNPVPGTTSGKLADLFFTLRNHITGLQLSGTNIRSFDQQNLSGDVLYELMQTRYAYYQQLKGEGLMSFGKAILQVINIKNGFDLFVEVLTSVEIPKHWWNPLCKPKKGKECHDCKSGYLGGFGLTQAQQLNFAFVAGLYNGLIDQVKGAAQLASFVISYLSNAQLRQKINEAVANLKRSDVYKATKRYTDQYINCGPHFMAYRSGRDVVNVLSLLLGFGELKAAAKSTEPFKTLVSLAKRNAKNYAKIAQYLPRMMVSLKNTGVKIISKTIDGVKVTLVYTSKAGQELLLTIKNNVIILARQLDQNLTGGKLLGTFDQVVLKTPDGRTITTKVDIIQKNDRVYIQKSGSGGAGKALDWRGLLSADGLKKIEKWDLNTQKALYDDLKGDGKFRQIIQEKEELTQSWLVLHKVDSKGIEKLGKKGELEEVRKYLDVNPSKSIDDVVKEIKDTGGYKKWMKALVKPNASGVTAVKIGSMRMSPKAKATAKNMEKAFNQVLKEFENKFKGFAEAIPKKINVVYSNGRTSFYMHKSSVNRYKTYKVETQKFPLSSDDLLEIQKLEKNGEINHLLEFVNKGFSGRSASQLKKDLSFRGVLAHEFGHVFHWNRNLVTNTGMTLEIVTYYKKCQDAFRKIPQSGLDLLKKGDELDVVATFGKKMPKEKLEYYWDAVGDLSLALSQGKIGFGRTNPNYYLLGNAPQKELIAHTTDFYLNGNPLVEVILGKDMVKTLQAFGNKHFK